MNEDMLKLNLLMSLFQCPEREENVDGHTKPAILTDQTPCRFDFLGFATDNIHHPVVLVWIKRKRKKAMKKHIGNLEDVEEV